MDQVTERKTQLRQEMLKKRAALEPHERRKANSAIRDHILSHERIEMAVKVAAYVSFDSEADTHSLINSLIRTKGKVILPRTIPSAKEIVFHGVDAFPVGFRKGAYGILEPRADFFPDDVSIDQIDVIIVPGVLFDRQGLRVGYGQGYYDRLFSRSSNVYKIGIGYSFQVVDALPVQPHDISLDAVITENGAINFRP